MIRLATAIQQGLSTSRPLLAEEEAVAAVAPEVEVAEAWALSPSQQKLVQVTVT